MEQAAARPHEPRASSRHSITVLNLPNGVLHEVLSYTQWPARATCSAFRAHIDAGRDSLDLHWPDAPTQLPTLSAMLARLPNLRALSASGKACPEDALTAMAVPTLTKLSIIESYTHYCWNVTDLSPLTRCTALLSLHLSSCVNVADISPLQHCTALMTLALNGCAVGDIRPLAALPALSSLSLEDCDCIENFAPLGHCTALSMLKLCRCDNLEDLAPLAGCRLLHTLDVAQCDGVMCVGPLQACTMLTCLGVGGSSLTSITTLATLTSLRHLLITNYRNELVSGCSPLKGLTILASLTLGEVGQNPIRQVVDCRALTSVWLQSCDSTVDLAPLTALPCLSSIKLSVSSGADPALPDLRPLSRCAALTFLSVHGSEQSSNHGAGLSTLDLTFLGACSGLTRLVLAGHTIKSVGPVGLCTALSSLKLWSLDPTLTDLSPLTGCVSLSSLELSVGNWTEGGWRPDLGSAAGCLALHTLDIRALPQAGEVGVLATRDAFPSLTCLAVDCRGVPDLGCLASCSRLACLKLCGGKHEVDTRCLAGLTALTVERIRGGLASCRACP